MGHIDEAESFGGVSLPHVVAAPRFALRGCSSGGGRGGCGRGCRGQQRRHRTQDDPHSPHRRHQCSTGFKKAARSAKSKKRERVGMETGWWWREWGGKNKRDKRKRNSSVKMLVRPSHCQSRAVFLPTTGRSRFAPRIGGERRKQKDPGRGRQFARAASNSSPPPPAGHRCPPTDRAGERASERSAQFMLRRSAPRGGRGETGAQRGFRRSHPGARSTVLCVPASAAVKRSGTSARCQAHVGGGRTRRRWADGEADHRLSLL